MTDTPCFVPASPGYWALEAIRPNGSGPDYEVIRIPVVGWEMRSSPSGGGFCAVPISTDDVGCPDGFPVLGPDGRVRCDGLVAFDSEREWLEDVRARDQRSSKAKGEAR